LIAFNGGMGVGLVNNQMVVATNSVQIASSATIDIIE
jgi:hypothetical protein